MKRLKEILRDIVIYPLIIGQLFLGAYKCSNDVKVGGGMLMKKTRNSILSFKYQTAWPKLQQRKNLFILLTVIKNLERRGCF